LKKVINKAVITNAIVSLIVLQNLPFRFVKSLEFYTLCKSLNPEVLYNEIISLHSGIRDQVEKSWIFYKDIVRKKLQSAISTIYLSLDVWTSPNQTLFLAICTYFVDYESETLAKALIGLPSIPSHHAHTQLEALIPILQDYGISQKIGAIIGDNASTNDRLCQLLGATFKEEGITWIVSENRIRCNRHVINLAVQEFLFGKSEEEEEEKEEQEEKEE